MKYLNSFRLLISAFALASQCLFANNLILPAFDDQKEVSQEAPQDLISSWKSKEWKNGNKNNWNSQPCKQCPLPLCCQIGRSRFSTFNVNNPTNPYTVTTFPLPRVVPLSKEGNRGYSQGEVEVLETGVKIGQDGNYRIDLYCIARSLSTPDFINIGVGLTVNGVLDFSEIDQNRLFNVASIYNDGSITNITLTANYANAKAGDIFELIAFNLGSSPTVPQESFDIEVLGWALGVTKIPCFPNNFQEL